MFHVAAFAESIDPAGALVTINGVAEQQYTVTGDDWRVPSTLANIIGAACLENDASAARAQIQSPSLRVLANLDVEPIVAAAVFGTPPEQSFWPESPVPVVPDESINFAVQSDPAAAALHYGIVFFADGPQVPTSGQHFTVRATATIAQTTTTWVNGNLTFGQVLPAGRYQVIGMRCRSTDAVAARLVFSAGTARPGCLVVNALADLDPYWTRFGRMGVWGEFPHTNPPTLDVLGGAAAAQTVLLDLIKVG